MDARITSLVLAASVILEIVLELKGIKVPVVVYTLSGFALRHIIGGETANNAPTRSTAQTTASTEVKP